MKLLKSFLYSSISLVLSGNVFAANVFTSDAASLDIGGRVKANYNSVFATADALADENDADKAALEGTGRLHVDASSKIYDGIKAVAFAEWDIGTETKDNGKWETRYAYVGFDTDSFGRLTFGQDDTALYNVIGKTDIFEDWGAAGSTYGDLGGRQEGQIIYQYANDYGLSFGASYQTAGLDTVDSGVAVAAGYEFNRDAFPISINLGYDSYDLKYSSDDPQSFAVSLSLGDLSQGFYAAGLYQRTSYEDSKDKDGYELVTGYTFENGFVVYLGYQNLSQDSRTLVSSITGEVTYHFNEQLKTYIETEFGVGDIDYTDENDQVIYSKRSHDKVSWGLQYDF